MNPMQFVREECANHRDGRCVGARINADLSITRCAPRERCRIADGERCRYFEECVAPMADMVSDKKRAFALREAVMQYQAALARGKTAESSPDVQRGSGVSPRGGRDPGNPMSHGHRPPRPEKGGGKRFQEGGGR